MTLNDSILDLVGNTPLVRLRTGVPEPGPQVFVKLEFLNPTGSVKDRMAYYIVREAIKSGQLKAGDTVIDNSSGNTGASLAMVAAVFGLRCIITTPEKTSQEKVDLIRSYGAELIVTPTEAAHDDPQGCYMLARNLAKKHGYFDLDQYNSQKNVEAHYQMTGPEIWKNTGGRLTHFVCGIGTGGTFSGTARFLKEQNPAIRTVAVDTEGSIFASFIRDEELPEPQVYQIEGIGSDVITEALHKDLVDRVITVSDKDAFNRARLIARSEGISGGGSSGAVAVAIEQVAAKLGEDAFIVGILADGGIRYLSKCYNDEWMRQRGYLDNSN